MIRGSGFDFSFCPQPQPIPNVFIPVNSEVYQLAKLCCNLRDADLSSEQVFLGGPLKVFRFLEDSFIRKLLLPCKLQPAARDGLRHLINDVTCGKTKILRAGREVAFLVALESYHARAREEEEETQSYLLSSVRDPFLVRCDGVGVDSDADQLWTATKLRKLGDLSSLCAWETDERGEPLNEHSKEQQHDRQEAILQRGDGLIEQMSKAVEFMHEHLGYTHNDIKPSNFFRSDDRVDLGDFETACVHGDTSTELVAWSDGWEAPEVKEFVDKMKEFVYKKGFVGKPSLPAPYSRKSDVFSLGRVFKVLLMKGAGDETLLLPKFAPLVERMLAQCPSERPTMPEVVAEVMELVAVDRQRAVEQPTALTR